MKFIYNKKVFTQKTPGENNEPGEKKMPVSF